MLTCSPNSKPLLSGSHVTISATLLMTLYFSILRFRNQPSLDPFEHLHTIVPFLIGENHWVTAVISIESRTIYVFDSMRGIDRRDKDEESGSEGKWSCETVFVVSFSTFFFFSLLGT